MHVHDGFYLRLGLGLGGVTGTASSNGLPDVSASGFAIPIELAVGGTPAPGVTVGVGSYDAAIPSLNLSAAGIDTKTAAIISTIGPFVDFFPDPTKSLHVQAAIALASVTVAKGEEMRVPSLCAAPGAVMPAGACYIPTHYPPDDYGGTGIGLMAGVGYEWWVGAQWGLGLLGRVQYVRATLTSSGDPDVKLWAVVPAVLLSATYH